MAVRFALVLATLLLAVSNAHARKLQDDSISRRLIESIDAPAVETASVEAADGASTEKMGFFHTGGAIRSWLESSDIFHGDGTAFSDAVSNTGEGFACSFRYINDKFSKYFAAINIEQWEDGASCGRCARVRCVDPRCEVQNKDVLVQIVDQCPECKKGDLDFSFPAYSAITGLWPHRLDITWEWASCAPEIEGTMRYDPKDGINPWFHAFYISGQNYPITSAKLNGIELQRSPFRFFTMHGAVPTGSATLELLGDNGATVTAVIDDLTKPQDLKVQFPVTV